MAEEHRDYLCFFWLQEFNFDKNIILRFKRIVFGLTCSPFLLNATVKLHLEKFSLIDSFKKFIKKLLLNLYVDDLNSFDNIKDATDFYKVKKNCLAGGNFILYKWATNCNEPIVMTLQICNHIHRCTKQ